MEEPEGKSRVLVIDDEVEVGVSAQRILGKVHEVVVVTSVDQAMACLAKSDFDVVLCDIMMPDKTGMHFLQELEAAWPERAQHVLFMTGGAFSPEAAAFLRSTTRPTIEKPFRSATLRSAVGAIIAGLAPRAPR